MILTDLEERFPVVEWRRPIPVTVGDFTVLACRACVAYRGLHGSEVSLEGVAREESPVFATLEEFEEHFLDWHGSLRAP